MNFSPFGSHFTPSIPAIHQFAAKFSQESSNAAVAANVLCPTSSSSDTNSSRYTANGIPSFTQHHPPAAQHQMLVANTAKYPVTAAVAASYVNQNIAYAHNSIRQLDKRYEHQDVGQSQDLCNENKHQHKSNGNSAANERPRNDQLQGQQHQPQHQQQQHQSNPPVQHQQSQQQHPHPVAALPSAAAAWQSLAAAGGGGSVADYLSHLPASSLPLSLHHFLKYSAETIKKETQQQQHVGVLQQQSHPLHHQNQQQQQQQQQHQQQHHIHSNEAANGFLGNSVASVGNGLLGTNLSALSTINAAHIQSSAPINAPSGGASGQAVNSAAAVVTAATIATPPKKRKKKKVEKEKKPKPRPGEIRLTTALDGSTLYCCPECHMAYPEKELLEQHLVGHTLERRFVCDICGAGLKRKDHLTRHKQSHNPERPYVCTVCLKAFKRKEQLTLHFVIHSGEKRHICSECGKGFYRKDHLRKHTRSHIARRVKAELSQHGGSGNTPAMPTLQLPAAGTPTAAAILNRAAASIMS